MEEETRRVNFWEAFNKIKVAYQYYFAFFLSIPSFLSIIFDRYIEPSFIVAYIPTLSRFILLVIVIGIPVLWVMAEYHYEKKPNRPKYELSKMDMKVNPWNQSITKALILISQGNTEEAVKELEPWVSDSK